MRTLVAVAEQHVQRQLGCDLRWRLQRRTVFKLPTQSSMPDASGENIFNNGGTVTSHGYNISSDNGGGYLNGPGDQINTDPLLGPLQNNGGPTLTHAPLPGSPAIDAGDPSFTPPPFNDQRGCPFDRVFNGRIDIGSVETQRRAAAMPKTAPDSGTAPNSALRQANRTQELPSA